MDIVFLYVEPILCWYGLLCRSCGDVTLLSNTIKQFHTSLAVLKHQKVHLKKKKLKVSQEIHGNVTHEKPYIYSLDK